MILRLSDTFFTANAYLETAQTTFNFWNDILVVVLTVAAILHVLLLIMLLFSDIKVQVEKFSFPLYELLKVCRIKFLR